MFGAPVNRRVFSKRSIHGQIAHKIGLQIVRGELPPGTVLPNEEAASAELDVSRTAYREALMVLAAKCLVESRPKSGTRIRPREDWNMLDPDLLAWNFEAGPSREFARSLFEIRRIFEPAAAEYAADRAGDAEVARIKAALDEMKKEPNSDAGIHADMDFHREILRASGNELLISFGDAIQSVLVRSFRLSKKLPGARKNSIPLHEKIFHEISRRRPAAARQAMEGLLAAAWNDVQDVIAGLADGADTANSGTRDGGSQ